jgi:DNA-binding beta-propeller fold protein YncE
MKVLLLIVALASSFAPWRANAQALGFISQWGSYGAGDGQFNTPVGVTTDGAGKVYVTDYGNARVEVFTPEGVYISQWTTLAHGFSTPVGVAVSAAGDVYVADYETSRIQVFSNAGAFIRQWGTAGTGPGQFNQPYGVALGPDGIVYVADAGNRRVQAFDDMGNFIMQWQTSGGDAIATDAAGRVYVGEGASVLVYSNTGSLLATYQMPPTDPIGSARGVTATSDRIYVVDSVRYRVIEFTSTGEYVRQSGSLGAGGQFNDPTAVCVDASGYVLVTDSGNNRVVKLGDVVVPTIGTSWGHLKALYR